MMDLRRPGVLGNFPDTAGFSYGKGLQFVGPGGIMNAVKPSGADMYAVLKQYRRQSGQKHACISVH